MTVRDLQQLTEKIRQANDIVDVVGSFVSLKPAGKNLKGLCPFHKEKTPSFNVMPDRQFFKCFGCNAAGDVFSFIQQREGVDFLEAREILARRANISLDAPNPQPTRSGGTPTATKADLERVNQWAAKWFRQQILSDIGAACREYVMWWGRYEHANKPCAQRVLVRPDELVAALGIGLPKTEGTDLIGPIRRSGKKFDILQYVRLTSDGLPEPVQEYWISRKAPYLVELVAFFDQYGRKAMTASLTDYQPAYEDGPLLAHKVSVFWPIEGSKLSLAVRRYRGIDSTKLKESAFARPIESPPLPSSVSQNIFRIDADCDSFDSGWNDFGGEPVVPTGIESEFEDALAPPQDAPITANEPSEAEDD